MQLVRNLYTRTPRAPASRATSARSARRGWRGSSRRSTPRSGCSASTSTPCPYGTYGGQTAIGAGAAARLYFDKRVKDLTLREAAMLAGMPQAPSRVLAGGQPRGHEGRRNEVLAKMAELGDDHAREGADRDGEGPRPATWTATSARPRALRARLRQVRADQGVRPRRPRAAAASRSTRRSTSRSSSRRARRSPTSWRGVGPSSAIVTIDPKNGDIVAMASSQYGRKGKSTFNLAAQGHRQPGSAFKIMALMTALREGVNPDSTSLRRRARRRRSTRRRAARRFEIKTYSGKGGGTHGPAPRDAGLRQLGLHPARRRPRPGQGQGDGADDGHQVQAAGLLRRDARRPRGRRVAARDGQRLRDDRQRRLPQPPARDPQDRRPARAR